MSTRSEWKKQKIVLEARFPRLFLKKCLISRLKQKNYRDEGNSEGFYYVAFLSNQLRLVI